MTASGTGPEPGRDAAAAIDEIGVEVTFELGKSVEPAGRLGAIGPGYVFTLDAPPDRPVTVRANGARFAAGRLVRIGDRLGVQLTEVYSHADQH